MSGTAAILFVDRPSVLEVLAKFERRMADPIALVCADGTPRATIARLRRAALEGRRAPVLYVHDAATVLYPFALEPLRTMVERGLLPSSAYFDLGLPPMGAPGRRFDDPRVPRDALVLELASLPPETLWRHCRAGVERALRATSAALPIAVEERHVDPPALVVGREAQRRRRVE